MDLPNGFFSEDQIQVYRSLVESLPDSAVIAELGVWQGKSLCSIADIVLRKNIQVYAIDTFEGTSSESNQILVNEAKEKDIQSVFLLNLQRFGLSENVKTIIARTENIVISFADKYFDLVFIDADHEFTAIKRDITLWLPKVKDTGTISGHDFSDTFPGVKRAVGEHFLGGFEVRHDIWIHNKLAKYIPSNEITAYINTKGRYYTTLPLAIQSIAVQTVKPKYLTIFDDNVDAIDLRTIPIYQNLFAVLQRRGISWNVVYGQRKGQSANHQTMIELAKTEWLWRIDDDDTPEPNCLEEMIKLIEPSVGGIAPLVWTPTEPIYALNSSSGEINNLISSNNVQWCKPTEAMEVDHLHNSFMYRVAASSHGYCKELSPVCHREETLFTYEMKRNGWKLLVQPSAIVWHMRDPEGGIRSHKDVSNYVHDNTIMLNKMRKWGVTFNDKPLFVLNGGLGDHICFKMILPEIKEKYGEVRLAVCYPEVFEDDSVDLISIASAKEMVDISQYDVYQWMADRQWKQSIESAYRNMYLN